MRSRTFSFLVAAALALVAAAALPLQEKTLPADARGAQERLKASPRHGEWKVVRAGEDSVRVWVAYPERAENAPVVLVVHEIFGLSHWIRAVADQLAAEGFIAIAPDLLTMKNIPAGEDGAPDGSAARRAISSLDRDQVHRQLKAVADWGMALPAAAKRYGIVGFCWGGAVSFAHALASPALGASVVYYGTSPNVESFAAVKAPVLGLYGSDDQRVNATIPRAEKGMKAADKVFEPHLFEGAGHGFLRQQSGRDGANLNATKRAWPLTVEWFRKHLKE